jgi:hypothetical protein
MQRPRPEAPTCARVLGTIATIVLISGTAQAARISVRAPTLCVEASAIAAQAGDLLGRPLASVSDVDFEIEIASTLEHVWRLRLELIDRREPGAGGPRARRTRELSATSCKELADAAAVAIAMSVRSIDDAEAAQNPPVRRPGGAEVVGHPVLPSPSQSQSPSPRPAIGVALVGDAGALPHAGLGLELDGSLRRNHLRVMVLASLFESQTATLSDGTGGTFRLVLGAALACFAPQFGRSTFLGCGGLEIGRLSGEGLDVARSYLGAAAWEAGRAEVGLAILLGAKVMLVLRGGIAAPLSRPEFVLDGTVPVYRPSRLSERGTIGIELGL